MRLRNFRPTNEIKRIDAERPADEAQDNQRTNANSARTHPRGTAIFNSVAARQFIDTHGSLLSRRSDRPAPPHVALSAPLLAKLRQSWEPTARRQFIDRLWQSLRQLPEQFLLRDARPLGERLDDVRPERIAELARRNRLVWPGAEAAAGAAAERIRERLGRTAGKEEPVELKFSISDIWSRQLFIALCRRYGLRPFRHRRMHRQTIMVKAPKSFIEQVLWPEFQELNAALIAYLSQITEKVIREEVHKETGEAEEVDEPTRIGR